MRVTRTILSVVQANHNA